MKKMLQVGALTIATAWSVTGPAAAQAIGLKAFLGGTILIGAANALAGTGPLGLAIANVLGNLGCTLVQGQNQSCL